MLLTYHDDPFRGMHRSLLLLAVLLLSARSMRAVDPDPHIWLEGIEDPKALDQVRAWNAATASRLAATPGFTNMVSEMRAILDDKTRIVPPENLFGDRVVGVWHDADHPLGLWRISNLEAFIEGRAEWRVLLDLDALSRKEGKRWVWKGALPLPPDYRRCMVGLSDGGTDAQVWREFDLERGEFVPSGFSTPPAKTGLAWVDNDTLLIATAHGGDVTDSGYARTARLWMRGTPIGSARLLLEGVKGDMSVGVASTFDGAQMSARVIRRPSFWNAIVHHVDAKGGLTPSPLPEMASIEGMLGRQVIARLQKPWELRGRRFEAGSLVAYEIENGGTIQPVFTPSGRQAVEAVSVGTDRVYVSLLEDVAGRLIALKQSRSGWESDVIPVPPNSSVEVMVSGGRRDTAFYRVESLAMPERLMVTRSGGAPSKVAALREIFDPNSIDVRQRFATAKDGTRIPYFVVRPAGAIGPLPTIMHAYGGYRLAQKPTYLTKNPYQIGPSGVFWIRDGGSFVIANIRGGGEYGPLWHEVAMRDGRQLSFDDLYSVGEDLRRAELASKLAVSGRSQGGLLVGVAMTQRPDLFDAVIMGVPLTDMRRFNRLLAGASWMGEYGNPDVAEDWAYLRRYSPYHNVRPGVRLPPAIIYTSTKDDRVHPGHARKFAALLEGAGQRFEYFENIVGGHAGTSDAGEHAYRAALMLSFVRRELMGK